MGRRVLRKYSQQQELQQQREQLKGWVRAYLFLTHVFNLYALIFGSLYLLSSLFKCSFIQQATIGVITNFKPICETIVHNLLEIGRQIGGEYS